jgi:hypothetical protein
MDTTPYPCEKFLARSLRERPGEMVSFLNWLAAKLMVLIAVAAAIAALSAYFYTCIGVQCAKPADPVKVGETTGKRAEINLKTDEMQYVWVQLMPDGKSGIPGGRLVRAIGARGGTCPTIAQGGKSFQMRQRFPAVEAVFPILLCEFVLIDNSEARIDKIVLPARADEPNGIVVIGDTGCRMVYWQIQPCRNPADWSFAKVAESASNKVVARKSFILHVGDFHYRENPCIDSSTGCGMSPFGDNWETWNQEFFEPAKPLLLAAPWVILRGNHEDCSRAGAGWIFLFALPDKYRRGAACDREGEIFQVNIGTTKEVRARKRILVVMDTSDEKNSHKAKDNCELYRDQLKALAAEEPDRSTREVWLAMHQPLWGRNMNGEQEPSSNSTDGKPIECVDGETKSALPVVREKFEMAKDKRIARLVLAGDNHAFQFFWPTDGLSPFQIIAGNGGTMLDDLYPLLTPGTKAPRDKRDPDTSAPAVQKVTSWGVAGKNLTLMQYGFTVLQRAGTTWTATQFDRDGNEMVACRFSEALSPPSPDITNCDQVLLKPTSSD